MKQFEYKTFTKMTPSPKSENFKRWLNTPEENKFLNEEGSEGWELVSAIHQPIEERLTIMYYFKRQIV